MITNKCGSCVHFNSFKLSSKTALCSKLGVKSFDAAPKCFKITPMPIVEAKIDVHAIGKAMSKLNVDQVNVLGQLIQKSAILADYNLKFGQKVYINLGTGAYLNNFFHAFVVGAIIEKEPATGKPVVKVQLSANLDVKKTGEIGNALMTQYLDSIYTLAEYKEKRQWMIDNDRLVEDVIESKDDWRKPMAHYLSKGKNLPKPPEQLIEHDAPSIDDLPHDLTASFTDDDFANNFRAENQEVVERAEKDAEIDLGGVTAENESGQTVTVVTGTLSKRAQAALNKIQRKPFIVATRKRA